MATSIFAQLGKASSLANSLKGLVVASEQTKISNLAIDCVHSEVVGYTNAITDHPVETKSSISDHIYSEPITITIDGTITDASLKIFGIVETPLQKNSVNSLLNNVKKLLPFNDAEKPSQVAFKILETICSTKQLVNVVTKQKMYKNMAIEDLSITNDDTTGHRLHFSCALKQLILANVQTTAYTRPRVKATPNIDPPQCNLSEQVNVGYLPPKDDRSISTKALDGTGNFIQKAYNRALEYFSGESDDHNKTKNNAVYLPGDTL